MGLRALSRQLKALAQARRLRGKLYRTYNFWNEKPEDVWLARLIEREFTPREPILFFSCFGRAQAFIRHYPGKKIFISGENLQSTLVIDFHPACRDHRVREVDLALGFEHRTEPNYYRFPLWIFYRDFIRPEDDLAAIQAKIARLNDPARRLSPGRDRFAGLISSHDKSGIRGRLLDLLAPLGQIDCGGRFRNNTDELKVACEDDKLRFLARYRFNLCPENTLGDGYTTEKIFECIEAGCIPIYWGAYLEPGILNPDAILRYEEGKEAELYARVEELWRDEGAYRQFALQPPFVEGAAEHIWEMIQGLRERLRQLLEP